MGFGYVTATGPGAFVVRFAGQVMVGKGIWSTTTLNVQVLVKHELVAVQTTGVEPTLKTLPLAGMQLRKVPPKTVGAV